MSEMETRRYKDLERFLEVTSRSGWVNVRYIINEMAKLIHVDVEQAIYETRTT